MVRYQINSQRPRSAASKPRLTWVNFFLIAAIVCLVVTNTVMTNTQVAVGAQASSLQQQRQQLFNQVSHLKWEVSQYKSLQRIQERAEKELGMEPIQQNLLHLNSPYVTDQE